MLIYEKLVNGIRKVFGSTGNVPTANDVQIVYKNNAGQPVELTRTSDLRDNGHGGMTLNGVEVKAWMGNKTIIPMSNDPVAVEEPAPVVAKEKAVVKPLKKEAPVVEEKKEEKKEAPVEDKKEEK